MEIDKVNIFEVAERAGVSKSTVSRALNNHYGVSQKSKEKVWKAIEDLKYRPNLFARYLRTNANKRIGLLFSSEMSDSSILQQINIGKLGGIMNKAKEHGFDITIFTEDLSDPSGLNEVIQEKGLSGILLLNPVDKKVLHTLESYGIPHVLINWSVPGHEHQCFVQTDWAKATMIALDYLLDKGYTDIGVITWGEDELSKERVIQSTFANYMKNKGLPYENHIWKTKLKIPKEAVVDYLEKSKKRAYLSFSYFTSMHILNYCREKNINIPADIALLSNDYFEFFEYLHPKLTALKQPSAKMGELALEKLIRKMDGEQNVESELVAPDLIIGDSC